MQSNYVVLETFQVSIHHSEIVLNQFVLLLRLKVNCAKLAAITTTAAERIKALSLWSSWFHCNFPVSSVSTIILCEKKKKNL